jgi:hypothetical protein
MLLACNNDCFQCHAERIMPVVDKHSRVGSMHLHGDDEGSNPVRSARTHLQPGSGQDLDGTESSLLSETDPIQLTDIDRVLEDSADVADANQAAPVRVWREELTVALESLSYAQSVLASDVGILRHCLANESVDAQAVVAELPRLVTGEATDEAWSRPADADVEVDDLDWTVCIRSDQLMTAHQEMAGADLSSSEDVTRVLRDLEAQLSELARRQDAVEGRLQQVRRAMMGQYGTGGVSARDWLG